jgi:hypothetical protein
MVEATCWACGHTETVNVDALPDDLAISYVADRLRCSECRSKKVETKAGFMKPLAVGESPENGR